MPGVRFHERGVDFMQDGVDGLHGAFRGGKIVRGHIAERPVLLRNMRMVVSAGAAVRMVLMALMALFFRLFAVFAEMFFRLGGSVFQRVVGNERPLGAVAAEGDGLHHIVVEVDCRTR